MPPRPDRKPSTPLAPGVSVRLDAQAEASLEYLRVLLAARGNAADTSSVIRYALRQTELAEQAREAAEK